MNLLLKSIAFSLVLLIALACGGGGNSVANSGGISGTGDGQLSKSYRLNDFDLAHDSYGNKSKSDFAINTLAPVFMISLDDPVSQGFENDLDISFTDVLSESSVSLSDISSNIRMDQDEEGKVLFISILKTNSSSLGSQELRPGRRYFYTVTAKGNNELFFNEEKVESISGYMDTKNVTITYPMEKGQYDSLVRIENSPLKGMDSLTPNFWVHSKYTISSFDENRSDDGYGILDKLEVMANGNKLFKSDNSYYSIPHASSTFFNLSIENQAQLNWGEHYRIAIIPQGLTYNKDGQEKHMMGDDIPGQVDIFLQESPTN
ncbi:MAG: hypothetical protein HQL32_10240 [Planctomycetes bacterium]|nr:hypothetical protein [Planctomycetota bacterium]